jgi:hypothetical protein
MLQFAMRESPRARCVIRIRLEQDGFELPVPLVQAKVAASCPFRFLR